MVDPLASIASIGLGLALGGAALLGFRGNAVERLAFHPVHAFQSWFSDYQGLLVKARELQRKDTDAASEKRPRSNFGWRVSPLQALTNIRTSFSDPTTQRLVQETVATTPWVLVVVILLVSLGGSFVIIRRASVMAQLFDTLLGAATKPATGDALHGASAAVNSGWQKCTELMIAYVGLLVLEEAIDIAAGFLTDDLRIRIEFRARKSFYAAVLSQDIAYLDSQRMTDMQRHLQDAPFAIHDAALVPARLIRYCCTFVAGLYSMCIVDWQLTLVSWLFRAPIALNFSAYTTQLLSLHWRLAEDMTSRSTATVSEALTNVRLVQIHAAEEVEANAYARLLSEGQQQSATLRVVEKFVSRLQSLLYMLWEVGSLWFAVTRILAGVMTLGSFNAFKTYQGTASSAFESLLHETGRLRTSARKCETFFEILDRKPSVLCTESMLEAEVKAVRSSPEGCTQRLTLAYPLQLRGDIEFQCVSFRYSKTQGNTPGESDAVGNVSLRIPAGSTAAFVGKSGGGKSTLFRLLVRFYDPTLGSILIDNRNISTYDARSLRRCIGFVEQEPTMLNRTIRDNICFGFDASSDDYPSEAEVVSAAKRAHIHDTIMSFPDGYATKVGERGVRLSGGEKQRLAVARAFVRNPSILLLDEPTAALDAESETMVKAGIEELMRGRTVLIIAHRLRTVQQCDQIFVVDHGSIAERGNHETLMRCEGMYMDLVRQQLIAAPQTPLSPPATSVSCAQVL